MPKAFRSGARLSSLLFLLPLSYAGDAHSQPAQQPCPDVKWTIYQDQVCYKEIRVINNTSVTIYAAIQSMAAQPTGDPWLAAAIGGSSSNYKSATYYRAYINPNKGIPPGKLGPYTFHGGQSKRLRLPGVHPLSTGGGEAGYIYSMTRLL